MAKDSKHVGTVNWRARFFWGVEWVYAIIGGWFEAWVYHAYTAPGMDYWLGWTEAITRACITQILVVLLAVAAVEIWRSGSHIVAKAGGFAVVQLFAVLFAFVAFWLMRVAAMAFQQTDILGSALGATLPVPFLGDVPAQELTLDIVAGLPFFQLVINLFAPIITKDHEQPTLDQLREQAERQRLTAEISQANTQRMVTGWVRVGKALATEVRGKTAGEDAGTSGAGFNGPGSSGLGDSTAGVSGDTSDGKGAARGGKIVSFTASAGVPKGYANAQMILAYIHQTLHRTDVTRDMVNGWMPLQPGVVKADGRKGDHNPEGLSATGGAYLLKKPGCYARAKKMWPLAQTPELEAAESAG